MIATADFDRDGHADLLLSQNFFGWRHRHRQTRDDAGLGLVLLGRGDGSFRVLDASASGLRLEGEQRTALVFPSANSGGGGVHLVITGPRDPIAHFETGQ